MIGKAVYVAAAVLGQKARSAAFVTAFANRKSGHKTRAAEGDKWPG